MNELVKYDAMLVAVAEAHSVDEAKDISDKAMALKAYFRQSNNTDLEVKMAEIQARAMTRIGELSSDLPTSNQAKGGSRHPTTGTPTKTQTLAEAGIAKSTANRYEQLAKNKDKVESEITKARESNKPVAITEILRTIKKDTQKQNQATKRENIGAAAKLTGSYPVIYADPPWRYESPPMGSTGRSIENHYPTMTLDEIKALPIPAADDAILFMWATSPKLVECFEVMEAWGFTYRTSAVWVKDKIGMGYYLRNQHELLLIGRKGELPVPTPGTQPSSVVQSPRGAHSAKPEIFYEIIEQLYPEFKGQWLEMFLRGAEREGWVGWGNEAE